MTLTAKQFAGREAYRAASAGLLVLLYALPLGLAFAGLPVWPSLIVGLPAYIFLVVVTSHRLRDAGLSTGWVVLMILIVNIGPFWQGPGPIKLYLSDIVILLIPILLGWIVPANAGAAPVEAV
jgi:uncharacterized membrane protein YhaH (DUF805 family)